MAKQGSPWVDRLLEDLVARLSLKSLPFREEQTAERALVIAARQEALDDVARYIRQWSESQTE